MLETIREYASERLVSSDAHEAHRRHAEYFRALAEEAEPHFMGSDEVRWLDRFELEHDNVRAALRWVVVNGRPETGLRLGAALWRFWFQRGHLREGHAWLTELLTMTGAEDHAAAAARAHIAGGGLAYWQNDFAAARRHYEKSATVYRRLADRPGLGEALYNLAFIPMVEGDFDASEALFREALKFARESGDRGRIMEVGGGIGYLLVMKGAYSEATPHVQESIALARELGNRFYVADGLSALAQIRRFEGELKASRALFAESLELFFELANHTGIAMDLEMLSAVESAAGRHERAARLAAAASAIKDRIGGGAPEAAQMKGDAVGAARLAMGDEVADRALEEGRAMDLDEVVAYAVADPSPSDRHS
jgi:tetratricopeptide (TPR) repeat protein